MNRLTDQLENQAIELAHQAFDLYQEQDNHERRRLIDTEGLALERSS